jgi:hypothetical protein
MAVSFMEGLCRNCSHQIKGHTAAGVTHVGPDPSATLIVDVPVICVWRPAEEDSGGVLCLPWQQEGPLRCVRR